MFGKHVLCWTGGRGGRGGEGTDGHVCELKKVEE
jgi:hypothetical protein